MQHSQRWKLVLAYHGAGFVGWQVQPTGRSVQGVVEAALAALLGESVRVDAGGRTDAGVHALAQHATFVTRVHRTPRSMCGGLNAHLPQDVSCVAAVQVPDHYDPRAWTLSKTYRYTWLDRPSRCPLRDDRSWHKRRRLDDIAMARGAVMLLGTHDFSAFQAVGCAAKSPVRQLRAARVWRDGDAVHLDVVGHGFLRHMVRIIAGTLTEVGHGRHPPEWVRHVLHSRDRAEGGRTAPAHGLTLVSVEEGPGPRPDAVARGAVSSDLR